MRSFHLAAVILIVAGLYAVASAGQQGNAPNVQLWEYKVLRSNFMDDKELNNLGSQGWELCAAVTYAPNGGLREIALKRPKR